MAFDDISLILHKIRVKLYPNNLKNVKGAYIARTDNERTLDTNNIGVTMLTRAGYKGNFDDMIGFLHQYNHEVVYQLMDGYAVTNGYYTMRLNIGGSFDSVHEAHDHDKHPIEFRFTARNKLRALAREIAVEVEGLADANGYIDTFTDTEENSVNDIYRPGNMFVIHGFKIRIAGDHPGVGVYFVPIDNPDAAAMVTRLGENAPSRVTGIALQTGYRHNRIEVRTMFGGDPKRPLKEMRTITSPFSIEEN